MVVHQPGCREPQEAVPAEEVLVGVADQLGPDLAPPEPRPVDAPDHRHRHAGGLAEDQVRSAGQLVDDRDLGDVELSAEGVGPAPVVDDRPDARAADGDVGESPAPRPAEGVADDHRHLDARPGPQAIADAASRPVAVFGQQRGVAPLDVRQVDAGVGADEAVLGLRHHQVAPAAQHPHRLAFHQRLVRQRVVGIDRDQHVLGLRHDLLGHDDHVAIEQAAVVLRRGGGDDAGQVVARPDLADAPDPEDPELAGDPVVGAAVGHAGSPSVVRARAAATVASVITVGATSARTPAASTSPLSAASASSITSVPASGA